jgi:hypothetical protein
MRTGVLVALMATACSSSYVPAKSPRIATVWRGGYPSYYRDGVEYPSGVLLDGVEDAVKGNPRAEEEASTAHGLMIGGFVCELAAIGTAAGAIGVAVSNDHGDSNDAAAIGLLVGSLVTSITGAILSANAFPHAYDAVNIYNDGLRSDANPAQPLSYPAPYQPPLPAAPPSMPTPPPPSSPPQAPPPPSQGYPPLQGAPPSLPAAPPSMPAPQRK